MIQAFTSVTSNLRTGTGPRERGAPSHPQGWCVRRVQLVSFPKKYTI